MHIQCICNGYTFTIIHRLVDDIFRRRKISLSNLRSWAQPCRIVGHHLASASGRQPLKEELARGPEPDLRRRPSEWRDFNLITGSPNHHRRPEETRQPQTAPSCSGMPQSCSSKSTNEREPVSPIDHAANIRRYPDDGNFMNHKKNHKITLIDVKPWFLMLSSAPKRVSALSRAAP